jgi:adenine/guanine phosphoribosyltransferase-like PRPP-binding protein
MPSAHQQGGTRNPKRIRDNLTVTSRMKGRSVIIVDDVLTSGGHLKAAADALRDAGATVLMATCAGRAVWERRSRVFGLIAETLEDL